MATETIFVQQFPKHGYEVRTERVANTDQSLPPTELRNAYTLPGGVYIGDFKAGNHLCAEMGIAPELASPEMTVCTIGFCETEQKWYGWADHTMISGFGIGTDALYLIDAPLPASTPEDTTLEELPYRKRPLNRGADKEATKKIEVIKTAKTLDDAKQMAICFSKRRS